MFRIANVGKNTYSGGKFVLSAQMVLRNMRAFNLDSRLSEMLFTTQAQNVSKEYKREAVIILVALSSDKLHPQFQSFLRSNAKALTNFIIQRYDATVQRKVTTARLPTAAAWDILEAQATRALMPTLDYTVVK